MPVGKNLWTIPADDCSDPGQPQHRPLNLHLAVEQPGNFCCDDGTCVDSELVCDNKVHCRDKTDERNCSLVVHKEGYSHILPPFTDGQQFSISAAVTVLNVFDINEDDSYIDIVILLHLHWFDSGLKFHFLKENQNRNSLTQSMKETIWTPKIIFEDLKKETPVEEPQFFVSRLTGPELNETDYTESYDGTDNPMNLLMKRRLILICPFLFQSYPFGIQTCVFRLYLQGGDNELAQLRPNISSIGPRHFGPYLIDSWAIEANHDHFTNIKYIGSKYLNMFSIKCL